MGPGSSKPRSLEEHIENLRKLGINWHDNPPPTKPEKPQIIVSHAPRLVPAPRSGPKHRRHAKPEKPNWSDESESEMMAFHATGRDQAVKKMRVEKKSGPPITRAEAAKLDADAFKDLGLKIGDKAGKQDAFVPWKFAMRYCELYVGKTNTPVVEPYFTYENVFSCQNWDFFYLYEPDALTEDAILFVPTSQLEAYLRLIDKKHNLQLTIPQGGNEHKFFIQFGWLSTPQPRYLGRTGGVESYNKLVCTLPLPDPEDDLEKATMAEKEEFASILKKVKESCVGGKGDGKGFKSRKNAFKRYENRKAWGHTTKRVQRYLGLRNKGASVVSHAEFTSSTEPANKLVLDVNAPPPFETYEDVVFISVDIETYEMAPKLVTEVGFAILDTRDARDVAPGEGAENWFGLIQGRHLRIREYRHHRNHVYVEGCPDKFEFGESEIVGIESIEKACYDILTPKDPSTGKPRKVVIVGHDVNQDMELLFAINLDVHELPGLLEIVDNQRLQQHRARLVSPQKLSITLSSLGIPYSYLHNGGNDAVLTLQSLLALGVRKRQESLAQPLKASKDPKQDVDPIMDGGWSSGGEVSDGGPVPPQIDPNASLKDPVQNWSAQTAELELEDK